MMKQWGRQMAAAAFAVATLSGCAGANLGALGDILGGAIGGQPGGASQVVAEVQGVDTRNQVIQIRTQQGQTGNVYFDQNTQVVYQNQQYPVTALERGDVVQIELQQTQQNQTYASRILVQQSAQDRGIQSGNTGTTGQRVQLSGRVGQVDYDRGSFQVQTQQGTYVVTLPYNAGAANADYFRRLRNGDTVRVEGALVANGRLELYRFL